MDCAVCHQLNNSHGICLRVKVKNSDQANCLIIIYLFIFKCKRIMIRIYLPKTTIKQPSKFKIDFKRDD